MQWDIFLSICQTEVDGLIPSESEMFKNFEDQVLLADTLGFDSAWVAESHLSCEIQKENPGAVIPHFKGEIGLNTDILQLAHRVFARTKNLNLGSAIRNILCNGGPIAHAEAVKTFLSLHSLNPEEKRFLYLGFASGRFPFSNRPYGIIPRDEVEETAWSVIKGDLFLEATEIFLRLLRGEILSSKDISRRPLTLERFRKKEDWQNVVKVWQKSTGSVSEPAEIPITPRWTFERLGIVPKNPNTDLLRLVIGAHDPAAQILANRYLPCRVFNLSITPSEKIDETHALMAKHFHPEGGPWTRAHMPRTALLFINNDPSLSQKDRNANARAQAKRALENYWRAMEGTLDPQKIENAVDNTVYGDPENVEKKLKEKYHPDDRLMLWFDFNNHNNQEIQNSMRWFMETVGRK